MGRTPRSLLLLVFIACGSAWATTVPVQERLTLKSRVLGEDRAIQVALPPSYASGGDRYPVLYLTDGQWQFDHARSSCAFLARNGLIPETIVVGITHADRVHDLYATRSDFEVDGRVIPCPTSGNADHFLEFVEQELIPWTERTYRTIPLRILAGHSAGGHFALHALRTRPQLFQAVIAASPWLAWDDGKELKELLPFLGGPCVATRVLFLSSADEWAEVTDGVAALVRVLRSRQDPTLRWDHVAYPDETHESVVLKAYFDALRRIFAGWTAARDPRTGELPSLDELQAHFAGLGRRLGCDLGPPESLLNELGYQYLRANAVEASLVVFRRNTELHGGSANAWDSLADGLERAGRAEEALEACIQAVTLAEANKGVDAEPYRKHAERLESAAGRTK